MKAAIGIWVRNEGARRWRTLIALGVLAGLAGGLTLAVVAGARRTSTVYERFRDATGRSDAWHRRCPREPRARWPEMGRRAGRE